MRKILFIVTAIMFAASTQVFSQSIGKGDNFGFGIILGEPTGLTLKVYTEPREALIFNIGASYFGSPRIDVDYIWHFEAFNSDVVSLYAGPGLVFGIGESNGFWYKDRGKFYVRDKNQLGLGVRGMFGLNFVPRRTPLEFFLEFGVLLGLAPEFGSAVDAALGMRFYP